MNLKKDFGQRIRELRNKRGYTQYQLAEIVGIDPKHISHIETGRSFPKADLIERFSAALDVDYTVFFKEACNQDKDVLMFKIQKMLEMATRAEVCYVYRLLDTYFN